MHGMETYATSCHKVLLKLELFIKFNIKQWCYYTIWFQFQFQFQFFWHMYTLWRKFFRRKKARWWRRRRRRRRRRTFFCSLVSVLLFTMMATSFGCISMLCKPCFSKMSSVGTVLKQVIAKLVRCPVQKSKKRRRSNIVVRCNRENKFKSS